MSDAQENAIVGRLVKAHAEARRRRELAATALRMNAAELRAIAERVEAGAFDNARRLLRGQLIEDIGLENFAALLLEEAEWNAKTMELRAQLQALLVNVD